MKREPIIVTVMYQETPRGGVLRRYRKRATGPFVRYPIWHDRIFTSPGLAPGKGMQ